ncbi:MAG: signal peptidase II [Planctomycetes bacterium]|nr:signal peptidase II [Planctomycetota bacterium]
MDTTSPAKGWPLFGVIAILAAAIDLVSKTWIFGRLGMPGESRPIELVSGILTLETNLNEGALFGMGQGMGVVFATVSVAAIVGIMALVSRPSTRNDPWILIALGLIVGGIIGNLYDRLGLPGLTWHAPLAREGDPVLAVRDWIHFTLPGVIDWPIFNLADSWLVIGALTLLYLSFLESSEGRAGHSGGDSQRA